jgi:hypothetical protein
MTSRPLSCRYAQSTRSSQESPKHPAEEDTR